LNDAIGVGFSDPDVLLNSVHVDRHSREVFGVANQNRLRFSALVRGYEQDASTMPLPQSSDIGFLSNRDAYRSCST
jgi:hypothetical protein